MEIQTLKRVFKYKGKDLSDPNPALSPEQVVSFYSNQIPELTTVTVGAGEPDLKSGTVVYNLDQTLGTKG